VHIYLKKEIKELEAGHAEIPLSAIQEIRVIEKNTGKTAASYIFTGLGIIIGVFIIITIIAALTKSSCPYIYVNDGESFVFQGETYGGAIAQNLERDDYMPLPAIQEKNGTYQIRISNELKEQQYTDLAQLIVVNHSKEQEILLDQSGHPQNIENAIQPINAWSYSGDNLNYLLGEKDKEVYFFNDRDQTINGVNMTFIKPANATKGKLVINGKNTLWFDYLFGKFIEKFGGTYDFYMEKQRKIPGSERIQRAIDNDFPLSVYLKKNGNWELVEYLFTVGPLASRDFVIPIELSDVQDDTFEVKVETGFMFWELDYAGMSFSTNNSVHTNFLKPSLAVGTGGVDWTLELGDADGQYMKQDKIGEVTEVIFKAPPSRNDQIQSVFLHSRGYYELIRDFKGLPEIAELNKFKTPGYFSEFSRYHYLRILDSSEEVARIKTSY